MKTRILCKCPYCGFVNQFTREFTFATINEIVYCDESDNGCGKEFVFHYSFTVDVSISTSVINLTKIN